MRGARERIFLLHLGEILCRLEESSSLYSCFSLFSPSHSPSHGAILYHGFLAEEKFYFMSVVRKTFLSTLLNETTRAVSHSASVSSRSYPPSKNPRTPWVFFIFGIVANDRKILSTALVAQL